MTPFRRKVDAVVIGAGQGGGPLASALGRSGRRTVVVERAHVGGSCINYGCTPTKTMVASARAAHLARRAADFGVHTEGVSIDLAEVRSRKRSIVDSFRKGSRSSLEQADNVELIFGHARFVGPREVAVNILNGGQQRLEAEWIFINTGAEPRRPDLEGLAEAPTLDSTSIMELDDVPAHLLVLGGGYVGLEFGQMFRRFGSEVTIVQRNRQLIPREDQDIADAVAAILREEGVTVRLGVQPLEVRGGQGALRLRMRDRGGDQTVEGSHLLVATGRAPATTDLNLHAAGIETDRAGHVLVNERLETSVAGVFALGDVKGGPAFTHISYDDYRILKANLLSDAGATTRDRLVPYTVFTDPQLGRVGLSEREARAQGRDVRIAKLPMSKVARGIETGETQGFIKAVVDSGSGRILGCAILGTQGGEIMGAIQIAMMGNLSYTDLRDSPFAHPTLIESLNNLFMNLEE